MDDPKIRLTQYSHGAGCGCKIAPAVLDQILHSSLPQPRYDNLLVGNGSRDDAAVYRLPGQQGQCVISTTDFFMPIVDDAYDFGRIASANAISDVYAMGGRPLLAIAVLGWPVDKLGPEVAAQVLEGARAICAEAGIPLAGGHSIDAPEPIFGLAVTGLVNEKNLKRNDTATAGSRLFLTKPLGVGMLTTAQKRGILRLEDEHIAPHSMMQLNKIGADLGQLAEVTALTDITGFGLLGHLSEVCEGSHLTAEIDFAQVPHAGRRRNLPRAGRHSRRHGPQLPELRPQGQSAYRRAEALALRPANLRWPAGVRGAGRRGGGAGRVCAVWFAARKLRRIAGAHAR